MVSNALAAARVKGFSWKEIRRGGKSGVDTEDHQGMDSEQVGWDLPGAKVRRRVACGISSGPW